jgi:3',5'-cyclic AMP phosphodiesterase CpdA
MPAFVLAHLSDPHLAPLPRPRWSDLAGKRITGYINWRRKRHLIHQRPILDALIADLKTQTYDHLAVTGDLANLALPDEFVAAKAWMQSLGPAQNITLIPGNHDAYVASARDALANSCTAYMLGDGAKAVSFPFVRRRGALAVIGLSSAVPTAPFMATGTLGEAQCAALADILPKLKREGLFRVVLVHHPLHSEPKDWYKRLLDSDRLRDVLRVHGAELILHGHDHHLTRMPIEGPDTQIPMIGVPSASSVLDDTHEGAAYNLFRVARVRDTWQCEMTTRGLTTPGALTIGELQKVRLG